MNPIYHCFLNCERTRETSRAFYAPIERSRLELSIGIVFHIAQTNSSLTIQETVIYRVDVFAVSHTIQIPPFFIKNNDHRDGDLHTDFETQLIHGIGALT